MKGLIPIHATESLPCQLMDIRQGKKSQPERQVKLTLLRARLGALGRIGGVDEDELSVIDRDT